MQETVFMIYKIECVANGRVYIGQSKNWRKRWNEHKRHLQNGTHRSKKLQRAWDKYGADKFEHTIIQTCTEHEVDEREIYWISEYDSTNKLKGFNTESGGSTNPMMSEEARKNNSEAQRKRYHLSSVYLNSPEAIEKRRVAHIGKKRGEITRNKLSEKAKQRVGEKNPFFGREHSTETKGKISNKKRGVSNPKKYKPLIAINIATGEQLIFNSRLEAEQHGFRRGGICEVLRGNFKQYKGYTFREG
jgi:group I intron endonuclease